MRADYDLLVIGGGVNGACIARDAAGRGLGVALVERHDLAAATSSASSKLAHGGLRYLEQWRFGLVREALAERETLLATAPHLVHPIRFVLPHAPGMRPAWMLRLGLTLYDHLARRRTLAPSTRIDLARRPWNDGLDTGLDTGFAYTDCTIDDARFVVLSAADAARRGADVLTRTSCVGLRREDGRWRCELERADGSRLGVTARAAINAAGPWALEVLTATAGLAPPARLRLVKGSHIVVPSLYAGTHAFLLQNDDGRVVLVIPFAGKYSLIGTTEVPVDRPGDAVPTDAETDYLCRAVNRFFARAIGPGEVVWRFAGIRALYDDGAAAAAEVTRECVLALDTGGGAAPLLSVFGGKITTARRTAERALRRLAPLLPGMGPGWTASAVLPGGDTGPFGPFVDRLAADFPALDPAWLDGLARRHGTNAYAVLDGIRSPRDLGPVFGDGLYGREVEWFRSHEWAATADDVIWRRSKFGIAMAESDRARLAGYLAGAPISA